MEMRIVYPALHQTNTNNSQKAVLYVINLNRCVDVSVDVCVCYKDRFC